MSDLDDFTAQLNAGDDDKKQETPAAGGAPQGVPKNLTPEQMAALKQA